MIIEFIKKILTQIFIITGNLKPIKINFIVIFIAKYNRESIKNFNYDTFILHGIVKRAQVLKQYVNFNH